MNIALIYNKEAENTTGTYFEKTIKEAGITYAHFWTQDAKNIPARFDLYLRIDHGDYTYDIPERLRPAVFYAIDTHLKKPYKKIATQAAHYDIVFCAQKQGAYRLGKDRNVDTLWLPLACDPDIHKKIAVDKQYDIAFVGSPARKFSRGRRLDLLSKKYPQSFLGGIDFKKMHEIYSAAKIGFNSSIANDINMRVFEIMSCGCFLLTNHIKNNGWEELFTNGKHLVSYKDTRELLKLADYSLNKSAQREQIAQEGFKLMRSKHLYYHRVQTMFNYIAFKFGGHYNELRIE